MMQHAAAAACLHEHFHVVCCPMHVLRNFLEVSGGVLVRARRRRVHLLTAALRVRTL